MNFNSEIEKFTSQASDWWNLNGAFKLLHKINPLRLNFIMKNLNHIDINSAKILDIGCGGGILCESLAKSGFKAENITGIDPGHENIEIAKEHSEQNNLHINYVNKQLEEFNSDIQFDIVISFEVIEHCEYHEVFLYNLCKLVKNNGLIFLSTINRTTKSYIQSIIGAEYILKWIPKGTHSWKKFLKPSEIDKILLQNNCEIKKLTGIKFDILNQEWIENQNLDVNYMLVAHKNQ